jgi:DNA-binding CsgD family transcriptional regulator
MVRRDRQPRGERNGQSKLTEEEVLDIRESTKPSAELADRYGVNSSTIRMIRTYATWTHLEGDTHVHRET